MTTQNAETISPQELLNQVAGLRDYLLELCETMHTRTRQLHPRHLMSAKNLLQYLALRQHDIRPLQEQLMHAGLSSLGRAEPHVMASIDAVHHALQCVAQEPVEPRSSQCAHVGVQEGRKLLESHTERLLGARPAKRGVRVMVTLPSEAAHRPDLLHELLEAGTDCVRINCAHDDAETWAAMISHLRAAEKSTGRNCRILMDLGGPKLRTGPVRGQPVRKARVKRNLAGQVVTPAQIWLCPPGDGFRGRGEAITLPVGADWLAQLNVGARVCLKDARGANRALLVVEKRDGRCRTECGRACYIQSGAPLSVHLPAGVRETVVGELPEVEDPLILRKGDTLLLTRSLEPGANAVRDAAGVITTPARIGCTLPDVFAQVKTGERIWFDDGKIGGILRHVEADCLQVEITQASSAGGKLRGDKGINLPESALSLPALTEKDAHDLEFVARHADMVGLSFVQNPADVQDLNERLAKLGGGRDVGIVLKIETRRAFQCLPELLLAAMHAPMAGVMIARGDLAIECGFERLAEVQEEILWICEAAHVPAIWATQVLESATKTGQPSRAEITDAAMAARAECVMLNKGPCILEAVRILNDILCRMQEHQNKKRALLRRLASWSPPAGV